MAAQSPWPDLNDKQKETVSEKSQSMFQKTRQIKKLFQKKTPQHEINKTMVIIGIVGVVALLFMASH